MWWNTLLLSLREIRRHLLRSFLTILGIVIGVSAVITMVTLGNGATRAVQDQITSLGTNLLMVRPGQRLGPGSGGAPYFKEADAAAVATQIGGIRAVAPEVRSGGTVVANGRNWTTTLTGSTNDYFVTNNWTVREGRTFSDNELAAGAAVCLIGESIRRELFGNGSAIGEPLRVKQFSCEIIGVLGSKGQGAMGNDQDDVVILPLHTVQRRVLGNQRVNTLLVSMEDGSDADRIKASLTQLLRERRKLADADDDNFNVLDTKQVADTLSGTTKIMTTLLGAVAAVSLLVGGIGIMNIMLVSVTERTREIGIRLAIGARGSDVLTQFLVESIVMGVLGGFMGLVLGVAGAKVLGHFTGWETVISPLIMIVAVAFSGAVGVFFGYYPARKAAALHPIQALRYE